MYVYWVLMKKTWSFQPIKMDQFLVLSSNIYSFWNLTKFLSPMAFNVIVVFLRIILLQKREWCEMARACRYTYMALYYYMNVVVFSFSLREYRRRRRVTGIGWSVILFLSVLIWTWNSKSIVEHILDIFIESNFYRKRRFRFRFSFIESLLGF